MRRFKMPTTLLFELGRSTQFEVKALVEFTYRPGYPAQISGPPERCYPAEAAEVEVQKISTVIADAVQEVPEWMFHRLSEDVELLSMCEEYAEGQLADQRDAARDKDA